MLIYSLNLYYRLQPRIETSGLNSFFNFIHKIEHGAVSKMENQKSAKSNSSSSGEISGTENSETEKPTNQLHYQHSQNAGYRKQSDGGEDSHNTLK